MSPVAADCREYFPESGAIFKEKKSMSESLAFWCPVAREGVVRYVVPYRRRRESLLEYVVPYSRRRKIVAEYGGPYRRSRESVAKYKVPYPRRRESVVK